MRGPRAARWSLSVVPIAALVGLAWWGHSSVYAPIRDDTVALAGYRPPTTVQVVDRAGNLMDEIGVDRQWVSIDDLPPAVPDAFVAAEDRRFWTHRGVDPRGILRAGWVNWRAGHVEEGGSTITQQVVKLLVVGDEPTVARKVREVLAAGALERTLPKERILELYLNVVYLGAGAYGVEAAAQAYFGVHAEVLRADQAALLASLVPAPSVRAPRHDPEAAARRRNGVLTAMAEAGRLGPREVEEASARPLGLFEPMTGPRSTSDAYRTETRRLLEQVLGPEPPSELGLVVHTAADLRVQALAERAVRHAVEAVDDRRRRRNGQPPRAVGEAPGVQGAAVVLDNRTGEVLALVGGYDDQLGGLVRATRSRRQPGSAFKPIVYAAALAGGASPGDVVVDAPVVFPGAEEGTLWTPGNHGGLYRGPITLRQALAVSSNSVAVSLADEVGLDAVLAMARALGIRTPLRRDLAVALGGSEVTPLELAVAFQAVARGGVPTEPVLITAITDARGDVRARAGEGSTLAGRAVELPGGEHERALEPDVAQALARMLKAVVDYGTGHDARSPVQERGGKTGTTNDYGDAWFVGFTPRHTIAVWIGDDDHEPLGLGETGGKAALPAFAAIADGLGTPGTPERPERLPAPSGGEVGDDEPVVLTIGVVHDR